MSKMSGNKKDGSTNSSDSFYTEFAKKIKTFDADPETIEEEDLLKLVEYSDGKLTTGEANKFIFFRDMKKKQTEKKKKLLAIPDLPQDHILTMSQMQSFQSITLNPKLEMKSIGGVKDMQKGPIDFSTMTAAQWIKVLNNCNALYARIFKRLGASGDEDVPESPLFFPSNQLLFGTNTFKVASRALTFHQQAQLFENFSDKSVMANISAGGSFQTPWVAGGAEYSYSTGKRDIEEGSKFKKVLKIEFPIGSFTLPNGRDESNTLIKINDEFSKYVEKLLDENPNYSKVDASEAICLEFGDVVPRSVMIGVACYTTETTTATKKQNLEEESDSFKTRVQRSFGSFAGEAHGGYDKKSKRQKTGVEQESSFYFEAVAGNVPDPNNPMSIAEYRLIPESWRIIDYGREFMPVINFLPEDIKSRLNKLPGEWPSAKVENEIFENITNNKRYLLRDCKSGHYLDLSPENEERIRQMALVLGGTVVIEAVEQHLGLEYRSDQKRQLLYQIDIKRRNSNEEIVAVISSRVRDTKNDFYLNLDNDIVKLTFDFEEFIVQNPGTLNGGVTIKSKSGDFIKKDQQDTGKPLFILEPQ